MNSLAKVAAALLLLVAAVFSFQRFRAEYATVELDLAVPADLAQAPEAADAPVADTNAPPTAEPGTNSDVVAKIPAITNASAGPRPPAGAARPKADKSGAFIWLGAFVASMLGIAVVVGLEIARWASRRTGDVLFAEDAPPDNDPEYDAAEAEWAKGNHLDAIGMMREYLLRNPSEQYVAIRIAEIYEKDLNNFLAATLELEEVLTKRLNREKWGWTAIHLANLYSGRLNQPSKAMAVLERIIAEYPETGAARKARERLGIPEQPTVAEVPSEEPESSNLPRGFSTKKK